MKKFLLILAVIVIAIFIYKKKAGNTGGSTKISGYVGQVAKVDGNILTLSSGLHVYLIGVEPGRTDVEMFLRSKFIGKNVTLYADSKSPQQNIVSSTDTVRAYVVENDAHTFCLNRLAVIEYPDAYRGDEINDSTGWVGPGVNPVQKTNLALYMKQRTFLIQTPDGIGTGFFINENGLAVTNWHVLPPQYEKNAIACLYQDDPEDSNLYSQKKRNFKNVLWSSDTDGLDITLVSVDLEAGEKVPYFDIARQRPNQGDRVATLGNPHGLTASYSSGVISAFRQDPYNNNREVDLIQYDMATNGGNSGGRVCDIYGQIVAVHELGDKTAQNINYGIDAAQLRTVLNRLGLKYGGR